MFGRQHSLGERRCVVVGAQHGHGPLRQDRPAVKGLVDEMDRGTGEPRPRSQNGFMNADAVKPFSAKGAREERRVDVEHATREGPDKGARDELKVSGEGDDVDAEAGRRGRRRRGGRRSGGAGARPPLVVAAAGREEFLGELLRGPAPQLGLSGAPGLERREAARLDPLLLGPGPAAAAGHVGDDDLQKSGRVERLSFFFLFRFFDGLDAN